MKPLDSIEIKLCRLQAKIFEESVKKTKYSSLVFIRRFMLSNLAKQFDDKTYLYNTNSQDIFNMIDQQFGTSDYGKIKYTESEMFWIGYIYRCICIKYNLTSKYVYSLFNATNIIKYYSIAHTQDVVKAASMLMESINYNSDIEEKSYKLMKRMRIFDKNKALIGKKVTVYVDRPIGYNHEGISYEQNYGYIKEFKAMDGEYQDAYVLGINKPLNVFTGKVIAIIKRKDDEEDKLIVCDETKALTNKEIEEMINFQEKYFNHKIIR